ncbi:MAG: TNT domain-containing protein [Lachnospiraceae bacterium]|nr:TNT domain-containing protein [Lachnospiraceae bacterium]
MRALAPHSENAEVHYYQLIKDYSITTGKVAPWFGFSGGGEQFLVYESENKMLSIKEMIKEKILVDITDLVEKGVIKID